MSVESRLAKNINEESEAYGYTLAVWGSGAILMDQFGSPNALQIFLFVGGALLGFGLLSLVAFDELFAPAESPDSQRLIVASTIHVFGTFGNLVLSYLIAAAVGGAGWPAAAGFLVVGVHVTVTYNLGLVTEAWVTRAFSSFDRWHEDAG